MSDAEGRGGAMAGARIRCAVAPASSRPHVDPRTYLSPSKERFHA